MMKELESVAKSIKNKEFLPVYFFYGEEPHFIDVGVKMLENDLLSEEEKAFGQTIVYGKDTTIQEILALARQFPMMGERMQIVVKEAQDLKINEAESTILENYFAQPVESSVLVFGYKSKIDSRKKFVKTLSKNGWIFKSDPVKDYQLPNWIEQECRNLKLKTLARIPNLLAEYLGNDLSRISNELQKLKMILKENEILDENLVEKHIGISKDFNVFELQNAISERNPDKAFKIAYYMGKNEKGTSIFQITFFLNKFFTNLIIYHVSVGMPQQELASEMGTTTYFLKDYAAAAKNYSLKNCTRIISILREIDLKAKGLGAVNTDESELLKELVYQIIHINLVKVKV